MLSGRKRFLALVLSCLALLQSSSAQTRPDLSKEPTLYVVGYAHLDTQWRWEYPQVINEYLPNTMRDNFALFEKYPNYVFNFAGAKTLTFPVDDKIRVLAVSVANENPGLTPVQPLYDTMSSSASASLPHHDFSSPRICFHFPAKMSWFMGLVSILFSIFSYLLW